MTSDVSVAITSSISAFSFCLLLFSLLLIGADEISSNERKGERERERGRDRKRGGDKKVL